MSANTHVIMCSLLSRKPLMIVYGFQKTFAKDEKLELLYSDVVYGVTCNRLGYCQFQISFVSYLS